METNILFGIVGVICALVLILIPVFILSRLATVISLLTQINTHLEIANHERQRQRRKDEQPS